MTHSIIYIEVGYQINSLDIQMWLDYVHISLLQLLVTVLTLMTMMMTFQNIFIL